MSNDSYEDELQQREARQKELDAIVNVATGRVVAAIVDQKPALHSHFFYGSSAIHPKHLVAWYLFHTDSDWEAAKQSGLTNAIEQQTRKELADAGYPLSGVAEMMVCFTSHEDIERETGGNYWSYFK
jgi:hypothetical protein